MFPNPTALWFVAQEIHEERVRQARRAQHVQEALHRQQAQRSQQGRLYRRWLCRLGDLLVATGQRLQSNASPAVTPTLSDNQRSLGPLSCC